MTLTGKSVPIDPCVIAHWKASLKAAYAPALRDFAKSNKHLGAGFRHDKVSTTVLLTRLMVLLDQKNE